MKVSVIVNVHNPGDTADACIRSVLEQTLPPDEYEVIFVDDGSTDGIAERLDTVASVRRNVRVLHLPYTGTSLRGRNVGIASARGDYVYLLDQGDRLERGALALMHQRAVETEADVLVGRLVRDAGPPMVAFEANRERADILRDRLLTLLTPHKLYRRAFLEETRLSFAVSGGKVAEQAFSLCAYLRAKIITVLADEVCCHLGEQPERVDDPAVVVTELRALLDVVDDGTEEGRQRDRIYAFWYRSMVLRPFLAPRFAGSSVDRGLNFTILRELVLERFPERLDRYLPVHLRAVSSMVRAGRLDQLVSFANASRRGELRAELHDVRWSGEVLELDLAVEIHTSADEPARFREEEDRLHWRPPGSVDQTLLPDSVTDVTDAVDKARIEVYVRHEETGDVYFVPVTSNVVRVHERGRVRVQVHGQTRVDVTTAALGEALPTGLWAVHVRMYGGAHRAATRVKHSAGPFTCLGVLAERPKRRLVVPCWSDEGELGLCIEPRSFPDSIALVSRGTTVTRQGRHVYVVVPVPYVPPSGGPAIELVLRHTRHQREISAPALVEPGLPGRAAGQLVAKVPVARLLPGRDQLGPGSWVSSLRTNEQETGLRFALEMRGGRIEVMPITAVDPERDPMGRDTLLRRLARRVPAARFAVRLARAGRHRYLRG
ncbi:glycosyltransferase family 2 protein [Nonomuraea sp. NPDC049152]|uniref:glycosyltransferase family 2 protein n=1 Tax=Nonomuraea sp. NPDC049152 TaxID=3154350 RepID=UPI0033E63A28